MYLWTRTYSKTATKKFGKYYSMRWQSIRFIGIHIIYVWEKGDLHIHTHPKGMNKKHISWQRKTINDKSSIDNKIFLEREFDCIWHWHFPHPHKPLNSADGIQTHSLRHPYAFPFWDERKNTAGKLLAVQLLPLLNSIRKFPLKK